MLFPSLQVNEIYLPLKRNQAFVIKFYSKNRELFERVLGQDEGKKLRRWGEGEGGGREEKEWEMEGEMEGGGRDVSC